MRRPTRLWLVVTGCLLVGLAAVGWLGATVLRLDAAQRAAQAEAAYEEQVRLALWRADALLTPVIVRESSRPVAAYRSSRGVAGDDRKMQGTERADPAVADLNAFVRVHFEIGADGGWEVRRMPGDPQPAAVGFERLRTKVDPGALVAAVADAAPAVAAEDLAEPLPVQERSLAQQAIHLQELDARNRMLGNAQLNTVPAGTVLTGAMPPAMMPVWHAGELFLLRRATWLTGVQAQGCWLNWPTIDAALRSEVAEIFPAARFEQAGPADADLGRRLAALPIRLVPGPAAGLAGPPPSPLPWLLALAVGAALLSALAVVVLLSGVVSLSERRAAFVSAVTHELRTPLTTFRLYTELLADNLVADPEKRREYLRTLYREADRLTHLVDNVLAYARLERGRTGARVESVSVDELLSRSGERLATRVQTAGFALEVDADSDLLAERVLAAPTTVEQILLNLVDNACKYAASADERRVVLSARRTNGAVRLRVRDFGPGVPADQRRRLFEAFHKSAPEAAESAPGVGLGLALCGRLAHGMGARLQFCADVSPGACFELRLRVATA